MRGTDTWSGPEGPDDRDLLAAHVAGDPEAFGVLFARHRDRLWAVALRTTGDPEEAADSLQDALISAFRRAGSYRGDAAVTTWLHRIVVNACLDRMRRQKVRATRPLPDSTDDTGRESPGVSGPGRTGGSTEASDPADLVLDEERRTAVVHALASLPLEQRAALVLVDMQGFSVQEAAEILDCAPGTVKSRCSRGRARLVPLLAELREADGPGPPGGGAAPAGEPGRPAVRPSSGDLGGDMP